MKSIYFIVLILLANLTLSCSTYLAKTPEGKKIDKRLVGIWQGSEKNQQIQGISKKWVVIRRPDGTYTIEFTTISKNNETEYSGYSGTWWIEDGYFYEQDNFKKITDKYEYKSDIDTVTFIIKSIVMEMNNESYIFIDKKISNITDNPKNGFSFGGAIEVKNNDEMVSFLKSHCNECTTINEKQGDFNERTYTILTVKNAQGAELNYYFDLKSEDTK